MSKAGETPQTSVAVEALSRLKGIDLESNPAIKRAVLKVLESTKGTSHFVEIIRDFKIPGQEQGLLEYALRDPQNPAAADAIRLILEQPNHGPLRDALESTNQTAALTTTDLIARLADQKGVPLLERLATNPARPAAQRRSAVNGLAKTREGASFLLELVRKNELPSDLKLAASAELYQARWPEIKSEANKILPLPAGQNSQPLPPISELVKRRGDAGRGKEVFFRPSSVCSTCHRVNGQGTNFGPDLSEIGTKLGKDAIYEAILDPSAGIAFGYEAWQVETKDGEEGYGLLVSETVDEISIKSQTGVITRFKKADILKRQQLKISIMPVGLQQTMSRQDFVDLVEFLSKLKKH